MTGEIPASMMTLGYLEEWRLNDNLFTGSIPSDLSKFTQLNVINLSGNQFTGGIPSDIALIPTLTEIHLQNNLLTGPLPTLINLFQLTALDVSGNAITGELPAIPSTLLTCDLGVDTLLCRSDSKIIACGITAPLCEGVFEEVTATTGSETSLPAQTDTSIEEVISDAGTPVAVIAGAAAGGVAFLVALAIGGFIYLRKARKGGGGSVRNNTACESSFNSSNQSQSVSNFSDPAKKGSPAKGGPSFGGKGGKNVKLRLVSKIDSGGFGTVWKGVYEGREVAVCFLLLIGIG
jgi:hypothetical protein